MSVLGRKAREAVFWTSGFNLFRDVLQLGQTLVLVRLLAPDAYGRFGLVSTIVGFFTVLSFREFLVHMLQVRDERDVHYQDHFTAGAVMQLAMCGLMNATAVGLRWTPTYASVAPMLHVMSVLFLLDLPSEFRVKMLERALDWKRLRLLNGLGIVAYAGVSIGLAAAGAGAYALLVPMLLVPLPFIYDLFVNAGWRPSWELSRDGYGPAARFGLTRITSVSFVTGAQLVESAVLVRLVGFVSLGLFGRAIGLSQLSCQKVASVLAMALYPVLTRIPPGSDSYKRVAALMLRSVAWVVIPLAAIVAVLGHAVVKVLFGPKWLDMVPLVPSALIMGAMMALVHAAYFILLAHQQQRRCLAVDVLRLAGTVAALGLLLGHGLVPYLRGLIVLHVIGFSLIARWLYRDGAITIGGLAAAIVPPIAASLNGLGLCELARRAIAIEIDGFWSGLAYGTTFALVYVTFLRVLFAPSLRELVGYLPQADRLNRILGFRPTPAVSPEAV